MNLIRLLRSQTGVTQQKLAALAGTSQPTIALYESGAKSPTLATLQRLALALERELVATYVPRMTREDRRSLAYHRTVAQKIATHPYVILKHAKQTLKKMRCRHPTAKALFDRWYIWLRLPTDDLITKILDPGLTARDMRQVTPFAGILTPQERTKILKRFRKEYPL
jgi:transcriptional regulator with XRE-family HTH domain